jgi:putative Holliday junction resolvase
MADRSDTILAFDVGDRRVGIAVARTDVRIASPVTTLDRQLPDFWVKLDGLLAEHHPSVVVVGLPRGLDGQHTAQTSAAQAIADELTKHTNAPLVMQDEALTSVAAEDELKQRGKSYDKADIDALAATYILTDYLSALPKSKLTGGEGS